MTTNQHWLTMEEACIRTRLSESTISRWITDQYLLPGIHYGGSGRLRRFDPEMIDAAVRFQDDPEAHQQAIAIKRKSLFAKKRA
jgi:predicted DNA-binding transcriptional regulator AlpA